MMDAMLCHLAWFLIGLLIGGSGVLIGVTILAAGARADECRACVLRAETETAQKGMKLGGYAQKGNL